jgi:hypothetical protein
MSREKSEGSLWVRPFGDLRQPSAPLAQLIPQHAPRTGPLLRAATPALSAGAISKLPVKRLLLLTNEYFDRRASKPLAGMA